MKGKLKHIPEDERSFVFSGTYDIYKNSEDTEYLLLRELNKEIFGNL